MDLLSQLTAFGSGLINYVIPFLFVLTIVVFFHELGHFLVARWCGVKVKAFSVGFGPEIFGFYDKHGTRWRFAWVPLGGYVKFMDDENAASAPSREAYKNMSEEEREGSFQGKTVGQRAAVVAAGPIANFILAIVIFAGMYSIVGQKITMARVDQVSPGSAAATAGFKAGDLVVSIDGSEIESFNNLQRIVGMSADKSLEIVVNRDEELVTLIAVPARKEVKDRFGNVARIGQLGIRRTTNPEDWVFTRLDPISAVWRGTQETYFIVARTLGYLGDVVMGREKADQLGGPLRIAEVSGQMASIGFIALLNLAAVLSVSIGLINLFPVPLLDGGHLVFYAYEAVMGRPLSESVQEVGFKIGLALVLMLMVFATWNDISRCVTESCFSSNLMPG